MLDKTKDLDGAFDTLLPEANVAIEKKRSLPLMVFKGVIQFALMLAILGGSVFVTMEMIKSKPEPKARHAFKTVYTIKTTTTELADHQPNFISYGEVVAARNVDLRSLVSGEVVSISQKLQAGARVTAGEALVEIDSFSFDGAVREARANLKETSARLAENEARIVSEQSKQVSARDQLAIAERDLARAKSLRKNGTMTQQQVEARTLIVSQRQQSLNLSSNMVKIEQARLEQQQAAIERLKWRLAQAERNLENTILKAPFAGIVRSSTVDVGKLLSANDVVVSLYEPGNFEAKFTLTDAQFGRLQNDADGLAGRKVDVIWNIGGREVHFPGRIERIGAEINSSRGGVEVYAALDNSGDKIELRPGAFVEIIVSDQQFTDTVKLPEQAIYNGMHVYVMDDGKLHKRAVTIVAYDGENVLISTGLKSGEKVLTTRIAEVSDGLNVREEGSPPPKSKNPRGKPAAPNAGLQSEAKTRTARK